PGAIDRTIEEERGPRNERLLAGCRGLRRQPRRDAALEDAEDLAAPARAIVREPGDAVLATRHPVVDVRTAHEELDAFPGFAGLGIDRPAEHLEGRLLDHDPHRRHEHAHDRAPLLGLDGHEVRPGWKRLP